MNKTSTILVMLAMATTVLAVTPTASADHGRHECTEEDPCNNVNNKGCEPLVSAGGCRYDGHNACMTTENADGSSTTTCNHYTRDCLINVNKVCQFHGTTLADFDLAPPW